jgi:hypothetical protein
LELVGSIIAQTRGMLKSVEPPLTDVDMLRELTECAIAADVVERMTRQ